VVIDIIGKEVSLQDQPDEFKKNPLDILVNDYYQSQHIENDAPIQRNFEGRFGLDNLQDANSRFRQSQ
jgi:hypothetical protein